MSQLSTLQIGLIASRTQTSGSDRYYFDLLRALRPLGVQVRGVVLGDPTAVDDPLPEIASFAREGSRAPSRWFGLRRAVAPLVGGSDVVVSHFAPHAFPVLDRIRSRPLVAHVHGPWTLEARAQGLPMRTIALRGLQEHAVYRRARRLVVLSESMARTLRDEYGVPSEKIRVVAGGVDLERFRPRGTRGDARRAFGLPLERPLVVTARRLAPGKGVENLIEAASMIRARVPEVVIAIAGAGPYEDAFSARVRELGLVDTVRFLGYVRGDDIATLYRAADLSVVPSVQHEGFGLVVIESLACGTPTLVTPVDGLPEVVRGLEPGLTIEAPTAPALADAIASALDGSRPLPDEATCIAHAQRFAWPVIAAQVREIYEEVA
ncbi:MAG TPA: glycosyltransferase family 4 protein [Candidatus Acidoferrum sp.]|nr:glycosyltransferase family 4 protein [Candidatus Acidoferrum sp.]